MTTKVRRQLNKLLLTLVCLLLTAGSALAAGNCGLRIQLTTDGGQPMSGIRLEVLQVARAEQGALALTDAFRQLGIDPDTLIADADSAKEVYEYVCAQNLSGSAHTSDGQGLVSLTGLDRGLYLVLERGGQAVTFDPCLVQLPGYINGVVQSVVTCAPKLEESSNAFRTVVKLWEDDDDAAGKRPADLSVTLLRDGQPFRRVTLNEGNGWQHTFRELPDSGTYTVMEELVSDYTGTITATETGFVLRNTYAADEDGPGGGGGGGDLSERTHVTVTKVWDDNNDKAGKRPTHVTVQLIADGVVTRTATLRKANGWKHTFRELDAEKRYTVREIPVEGYAASYTGNAATGIRITNTYTGTTDPGMPPPPVIPQPVGMDIPLRVDWIDENNAYGTRPKEVTVHLLAGNSIAATLRIRPAHTVNAPAVAEVTVDGNLLLTATLTHVADDSWYGVFKNAPADLPYSVWEEAVTDYSTTYSGSAAEGFVVTNVYTPGTTDPGTPPEPDTPVIPPEGGDTPGGEGTDPGAPGPGGSDIEEGLEEELPSIPQTGAQLLPVYLLMAVGTVLVLLGVADLYKGREE